jgi:hypothetical protein
LARGDARGPQVGDLAFDRDVPADADGVAPNASDPTWGDERSRQLREPHFPLVAPNPDIDIDHVVVRDRDPAEPVVDAKASLLERSAVVPDNPNAVVCPRDAEPARLAGALQLGAGTGGVVHVSLRHFHLVERLSVAKRDLAICPAEVAGEVEGDQLVDDKAAVRRYLDGDVRGRQRERLCGGVPGERERRENNDR